MRGQALLRPPGSTSAARRRARSSSRAELQAALVDERHQRQGAGAARSCWPTTSALARAGRERAEPLAGLKKVRPSQLARTVEALTGFRWQTELDFDIGSGTVGSAIDLMRDAFFGFEVLAGGIDSHQRHPARAHTMTASACADARSSLAARAAPIVVDADFARRERDAAGCSRLVDADDGSKRSRTRAARRASAPALRRSSSSTDVGRREHAATAVLQRALAEPAATTSTRVEADPVRDAAGRAHALLLRSRPISRRRLTLIKRPQLVAGASCCRSGAAVAADARCRPGSARRRRARDRQEADDRAELGRLGHDVRARPEAGQQRSIDAPEGALERFGELPILTHASRPTVREFFQRYGGADRARVNGMQVRSFVHPDCIKRILTGTPVRDQSRHRRDRRVRARRELPVPYLVLGNRRSAARLALITGRAGTTNQLSALSSTRGRLRRPGRTRRRSTGLSRPRAGRPARRALPRRQRGAAARDARPARLNARSVDEFLKSLDRASAPARVCARSRASASASTRPISPSRSTLAVTRAAQAVVPRRAAGDRRLGYARRQRAPEPAARGAVRRARRRCVDDARARARCSTRRWSWCSARWAAHPAQRRAAARTTGRSRARCCSARACGAGARWGPRRQLERTLIGSVGGRAVQEGSSSRPEISWRGSSGLTGVDPDGYFPEWSRCARSGREGRSPRLLYSIAFVCRRSGAGSSRARPTRA